MKCDRCLSAHGGVAEFRVRTDVIDDKVCSRCADEARAIGLSVTKLDEEEAQARDDIASARSARQSADQPRVATVSRERAAEISGAQRLDLTP